MKKEKFIKDVENVMNKYPDEFCEDAREYFEALKEVKSENKELITEKGKEILRTMRELDKMVKAKDIADAMGISSRTVSGSLRKLSTDGFVEKIGKDPIIYALTDLGKEIEI